MQLFAIDNCVQDWRIAMSWKRVGQIMAELTVCAVHPVPGSFYFTWTEIHADGETVTSVQVSAHAQGRYGRSVEQFIHKGFSHW